MCMRESAKQQLTRKVLHTHFDTPTFTHTHQTKAHGVIKIVNEYNIWGGLVSEWVLATEAIFTPFFRFSSCPEHYSPVLLCLKLP